MDWCNTADDCGEYSLVYGYWDYCQYLASSKPDWVAMDWQVKQDLTWTEIQADPTFGEYHSLDMFTESVVTSFENQWDVMPAGRVKVIHGIGAVCPFSIDVAVDSPYTGVFKPGQVSGLVRMGAAADWTSALTPGMTPGVGVKIFRTGVASANVVMINSLLAIPDDNHDFFAVPLSNVIPDVSGGATDLLAQKFCSTGHCITKVGLSDMASYDQEGTNYAEPVFPFKIAFEPADVHFQEAKPDSMEAFMSQFDSIEVGTTVYTLRAYSSPDDTEGTLLGNVVTTDNCVSSNYGDTQMFFKHQWIEDDITLKPEWADAYYDGCHCNTP